MSRLPKILKNFTKLDLPNEKLSNEYAIKLGPSAIKQMISVYNSAILMVMCAVIDYDIELDLGIKDIDRLEALPKRAKRVAKDSSLGLSDLISVLNSQCRMISLLQKNLKKSR